MTNENIKSRYIRGLAAREILGYRRSYWRSMKYCHDKNVRHELKERYDAKVYGAINAFGRVDLHMRRYPEFFMSDDATPLNDYNSGFAGHD